MTIRYRVTGFQNQRVDPDLYPKTGPLIHHDRDRKLCPLEYKEIGVQLQFQDEYQGLERNLDNQAVSIRSYLNYDLADSRQSVEP